MLITENTPYRDETMTRAARAERTAWRLQNLAEWRHGLVNLTHYHAEYPYDVGHEYEGGLEDWTSDPDYIWPDVHLEEFDEDGHLILRDPKARDFLWSMDRTSRDRLGNRSVVKPDVYFDEGVAECLNLFTRQGNPKNIAVPDLAVLLPVCELPPNMLRPMNDCVFRLDKGDPAPELVLKYLATTLDWQLHTQMQLYAALGVIEYLVYDPGGMRTPDSPTELLVHRLEAGAYRAVAPDPNLSEPGRPAIESEVFGTHIRIDPDYVHPWNEYLNGPRFQWYDAAAQRWRDHETDKHAQDDAESHAQGQVEGAIDFLNKWLETKLETKVREHVAEFWRTYGRPEDVADRLVAVWQTPSQWPFLLLDPAAGPNRCQEEVPATFRRQTQGGEAIGYLHTLLQVELEPKVRERIAAVWREQGPPEYWYENIRAVQRTPHRWHALLLETEGNRRGNTDRVPDTP